MTLILGCRCKNGVSLVADRKFIATGMSGQQHEYGDKITGEIEGILTGFSGDVGTFQVFAVTLRDYVVSTRNKQIKYILSQPLMRIRKPDFGPTFEQVMLRISQLQADFHKKYDKYRYHILVGVSSRYSTDINKRSRLYFFYADGRYISIPDHKGIGSGSPYASYFLKRYVKSGETTMEQFAQLGDFIIRYISHSKFTLDDAVGLSDEQPYPKVMYIPDDPDFCKPYNQGNPKLDCSPTIQELNEFKSYSEEKLKNLHSLDFFNPTTVGTA
jgi:20S proteasome alpha/beta subunit